MSYYEYTKRLGQQHWAKSGKHQTMCGMPMLGNNYDKYIDDEHKMPCEDCRVKMIEEVKASGGSGKVSGSA